MPAANATALIFKQASRFTRVNLVEEEVEKIKAMLKLNGPAYYEEIERFLSHPFAQYRLRLVAGSRFAELAREFLAGSGPIAFVMAYFLLTKAFHWENPFSWVVLLVLIWPFFKQKIEQEINYELFARLICLDERIRRSELDLPGFPFIKNSPFSEN